MVFALDKTAQTSVRRPSLTSVSLCAVSPLNLNGLGTEEPTFKVYCRKHYVIPLAESLGVSRAAEESVCQFEH